jgi:hypothetical protein
MDERSYISQNLIRTNQLNMLIQFLWIVHHNNRNAIGIATDYGLDGRGVGIRVPVRAKFFPLHVIQTGSGAQPASYPMSLRGKAVEV